MIRFLISKYKSSKGLVHYFLLTYIDKIVSFALPLSILFILKDKPLYNFIEAAFSYATLIMIALELGVSNYLFFGYKQADDKDKFIRLASMNFRFLLSFYAVISILFLAAVKFYDASLLTLFWVVTIRALFVFYLSFQSNIFRLRDRPSGIYKVSLAVNLASFILLLLASYFSKNYQTELFFIPSLMLIVSVCAKFVFTDLRHFRLAEFGDFLKNSLVFAWPVILNVLSMSFINNYAKIFAYGHLPEQEMVQVSFIMRIGLIIQLTHAAFSSFFSKSLFMDESHRLNFRIFSRYSITILSSAILVILAIVATNLFFKEELQVPLSLSTFLFLSYIILWCFIGYLEIYFGIRNANRRVLFYSAISSAIYIILLRFCGPVGLLQLSIFMVISTAINLMLVILGLKKMDVITLRRNRNQ